MCEAKVNMEVLISYLHIQLCYFNGSRRQLNVIFMARAYHTIDSRARATKSSFISDIEASKNCSKYH